MVNTSQAGGKCLNESRRDTGNQALGQYLAAKRLSNGLSYRELASKIGKAPSTIQSWESGKRMPSLDDLFVLSAVFNTDLEDLISLAATPLGELEKRLSDAHERYKKALRAPGQSTRKRVTPYKSSLTGVKTQAILREITFLNNLIAQRKRLGEKSRFPTRAVPLYDLRKVPVVGAIRAGQPRLAVEDALGYTGVPEDLDVDYALVVEGDSMVGAGIASGDVVWVKQASAGRPGDTVVALLAGEEVTVKHLVIEDGRHVLRANNPNLGYPDIPLGPEDRIIGVVQRVVKRPGPPPRKSGENAAP